MYIGDMIYNVLIQTWMFVLICKYACVILVNVDKWLWWIFFMECFVIIVWNVFVAFIALLCFTQIMGQRWNA